MMSSLSKEIERRALQSSFFDFPGFKVQAYHQSKKIIDAKVGKTFPFYDLASLTKIIFTTTYFMSAIEDKKLKLEDKVFSFLPWYNHKQVRVAQLLNHSAGNDWWQPFYKKIKEDLLPEQSFQQMEKFCQQAPLSKASRAVYSDLDFYLLGSVMQTIERKPLIQIWSELKEKYYPKTKFHFNYSNQPFESKSKYAPTEDCSWRKKIMVGEVHDENAWALGGVAPHAGLFGRIDDLSCFGLLLRQSCLEKEKSLFVSGKILKKFTSRSMPSKRGDWGYGFMIPSKEGSSAGDFFSKKSFGHTGFSGTSLWFDPEKDLLVTIVSNRVHPTRDNRGFVSLRPKIHDWVCEFVKENV